MVVWLQSKRSTQTTAPQPVASSQAASQVAASPQAATSAPAQTHTPKPIATGTNAHASAAQATSPSRPEDNYAISDNESRYVHVSLAVSLALGLMTFEWRQLQ